MASTIYASSGDGFVRNNGAGSWSSLQSAGTGTVASQFNPANAPYNDGTSADKYIDRGIFSFDLSSIPAGATITAATLRLYVTAKASGAGGSVGVTSASPASTTTLATSDFGLVGSTEYATRINFASATTSAYNDFALNASGLTYLEGKIGTTAGFAVRGSFDIDNSAPGTTVYSSWSVSTSEQSGTSQDPKLELSYSLARTTGDTWAWSDDALPSSSLTETFYAGGGDGRVRHTAVGTDNGTWTTVRSAATGTSVDDTSSTIAAPYSNTSAGGSTYIDRLFLPFDTSGLPNDAELWSATVSFVPDVVYASGSLCLVAGTQASTSALATADFDAVGSTELAYNRIPCSSMVAGTRYTFRLNAAGLAEVSKTGFSKFAVRTSYDLDNTYAAATESGVQSRLSEYTGVDSDPRIQVSYWYAGVSKTTSDTWAWSDSLAVYRRAIAEVEVWAENSNTQLNGAQTLGATVTVDDTTGFPSSGTLYAIDNTNAIQQQATGTYSGKTGTTFTGCSWTSIIGKVTYADGSLAFADNTAIGLGDCETHFPQVFALDDVATDSTPELAVTAKQGGGHSVLNGRLVMKKSTDGGLTWGSQSVIATAQQSGAGIFGHTSARLKNGRLLVIWYEHKLDYVVADSTSVVWTYMIYSDDRGSTWSSPVNVPVNAGYSNYDGSVSFSSTLYTGSGSNSTYGDLYVPFMVTKTGKYVHSTAQTYRHECWLYKITDGGAGGTVTKVAEVFKYADTGRGCAEGSVVIADNGDWIMQARAEPLDSEGAEDRDRWQSVSTDDGATWSTPAKVIDAFANGAVLTKLPGGTLISTGSPVLGSDTNYGQTGSVLSHDSGTTWTRSIKYEATDATYSIYNGSDTEVIVDDAAVLVNTAFTYAQERSNQGGARTMFRWYVDPVKRTSDEWAWSDVAVRGSVAYSRATSDSWAWSDTAVGSLAADYARTTSDTWAWSDTTTGTTAQARTTADTWAWSDAAVQPVAGSYSRTTSDTWAWTDSSGTQPATIYWLRAARRRSMSAPVKTYVQVLPKGTTSTTSYTSPTYEAKTEAGILVVLDVTSASGTGGLQVRINAHDQASGQAVALNAAPTAVTATGTTSYVLYPFGAVAGNVTQATSFYLPRLFSITVTAGDSSSYTYSLGYCLLP